MKITDLSTPVFGGGKSGGGASKQITLLSVTTAPTGTFAKGSQYYNSNTKKIYTAVVANSWNDAKIEDPQFGVIYLFDNQGTTEYYQWDGDNLVETDLEKYQLIANKTDDFTESSKNKYPSSFALFKGLAGVRPNKVNNSGASLPVDLSDYSLGDTFLNITNKKLYKAIAQDYILSSGTTNGGATINYQTGEASNLGYIPGQYGPSSYCGISRSSGSIRWEGNKTIDIHFKLTDVLDNNHSYILFSSGYNGYTIGLALKKDGLYFFKYNSYQSSFSFNSVVKIFDFNWQTNIPYYLRLNKLSEETTILLSNLNYDTENIKEESVVIEDFYGTYSGSNSQYLNLGTYPDSRLASYIDGYSGITPIIIYLLDTTTKNYLSPNSTLIWNDGENLIDLAQYADITNGILYFYCENQLFSNKPNNLTFNNVSASTWVADNTYQDYGYKCELNCNGVKANSFVQVIFSPTEADSGNYASVCLVEANKITIYSKVNDSITIPSIVAMEV